MGMLGPAGSTAVRARAREERSRAERLRRDAATNRRHTEALCDRLAERSLSVGERSYGDHGNHYLLRLGRLRPLLRFARNDLRRWLESRDLPPEVVDEATLACSEACANAIEHPSRVTRQLVEIEGHRDATDLVLRVRDYGSWTEHARTDVRGRGISMIRQLMDTVDIQHLAGTTEIVMCRHLATGRRTPPHRGVSPPARGKGWVRMISLSRP